jgi:hypothetical protein
MRSRLVLFLAVGALALASGVERAGAATGVRGTVLTPSRPVCIEGRPCSEPAPGIVLVFRREGGVTARTTTRADGTYRVLLRRGLYRVSIAGGRPMTQLTPSIVRVVFGRVVRVDFELDRGLQ